ncbi:MAG: Ribonuclease R [Chroococcopsis gigantea SAG 12.99]|jgi:ribonuclease R|nr:VacB/RNase II family 3'-5' exoribonuclease [Chlorogloea purpurea SAG 13.99]MDV2998961.1 Ribonuclease R [Chroococcopsis gigantea SAG 12.99]
MDFSIATLLSYLTHDKFIAPKVLEKKLGCEDETSIEKLQIILDALERLGIIVKERGRYKRVTEDNVVEAKLRCSSKEFCFAIQDEEDADDIYVSKNHLSNAWNGDRVLIRIIKEGTRRRSPEGEVRLILERANPSLLAQIKETEGEYLAIPLDDRLKFTLNLVANGQDLQAVIDHLVHVSVLRYPIGEHPPLGKVTRVLGSDAEAAADTDIVCCKHDLPHDFPEEVIKAAQQILKEIGTDEKTPYRDLTQLLTFTLENEEILPHLTLIENAFSLEKLEENKWQVGFHITDVAHYVPFNCLVDRMAKRRGTTVYLGEKILPLIPEIITEKCSLTVGKEQRAISVLITLDERGQISEYEITPSLIKISHALTYQKVQDLLSQGEDIEAALEPVLERLRDLFFTICPLLKAQRLQRGSFEVQLEKTSVFKDEGRCGTVLASNTLPVSSLLAEMVVVVNKIVGQHLSALGVPTIYCGQPQPDWEELEDLLKLSGNLGIEITLNAEEDVTPSDYQNLTRAFSKTSASKVLYYILQSGLKTVKYSSHPIPHFGLAYTDAYAHCVSPGQRYGDLWIQRVLKSVFSDGKDRRTKLTKVGVNLGSSSCVGQITWNVLPPDIQQELEEEIHTVVTHLNDRDKIAEDAEKDLEGLKKADKMKERTGQVFRGLITGVQSYGFFVEIEDLLVEGLVHVSSLKDDWYEYRARHSCLVGRKNRIAYRLGDEVEVQVKDVDYYRQQIDLVTVSGGSSATYDDLEED